MNYTEVINNAINEYEEAKRSGKDVEQAINGMENVYIMVSDKNVKDSDNLRKTILEARTNKLIAYYDWYANAWEEAAQKAKSMVMLSSIVCGWRSKLSTTDSKTTLKRF